MTTTIEVLAKVMELLGGYVGEATGGSTTTLQNTNHEAPDDYFNGGCIAFLSGDNANKSTRITDYANTNGVFTFATQANAIANGDKYVAIPAPYNRSSLISAINSALEDLGNVGDYDILTISETEQEEYTLPDGVSGLTDVEYPNSDDDTEEPFEWLTMPYWDELNGKLVIPFKHMPLCSYVRIWYNAPHGDVDEDDDDIHNGVHKLTLAWTAVYYAVSRRMNKSESSDPKTQNLLSISAAEKERLKSLHPNKQNEPTGHLAEW